VKEVDRFKKMQALAAEALDLIKGLNMPSSYMPKEKCRVTGITVGGVPLDISRETHLEVGDSMKIDVPVKFLGPGANEQRKCYVVDKDEYDEVSRKIGEIRGELFRISPEPYCPYRCDCERIR